MAKIFLSVTLTMCLLALLFTVCCKKQEEQEEHATTAIAPQSERRTLWSDAEQAEIVQSIQAKLEPHQLQFVDDTTSLQPHQFLHLHHMKTGGTSMDHLLKCAMDRLKNDFGYDVPYYNIHECWRSRFRDCVQKKDLKCQESMDGASMMSFCAALHHLEGFGWNEERVRALTVLRHPVDRVWSMFRFEPRNCYKCKNLTDIYDVIDSGETRGYDRLCLAQLQNHEVENLLTSDWPEDASDEDKLAEAIENMKSFFTVIGLTEDLPTTVQILGETFPWLNTTMQGSNTFCHLTHENSSPTNNHCVKHPIPGEKHKFTSSHWDLPAHPDPDTLEAIAAHNQLDMKLYEAAVEYFELQKRAFEGMGQQS